ncbi:hypothetical protein AB1Y20_004708 [Prymnesium parvum]|uniref:NTP pyrophosphohydrolase MazG-like domain-containing protein n=1 Tax=Prymnesium parvum TaxID=97485 RepID=A0AB34IZJ8_PRYPA
MLLPQGLLLAAAARRTPCALASHGFAFSNISLETLRAEQRVFVDEREWGQFHTPRSLALALVGEVGELCELLQWRGDEGASGALEGWTSEDRGRLSDELADVLSYVIRLADVAQIDLPAAARDKLAKNREKYPADLARGSSAKYTKYDQDSSISVSDGSQGDGGSAGGEGEWGTPEWVSSAYERAAARLESTLPFVDSDRTSIPSKEKDVSPGHDGQMVKGGKLHPIPDGRVAATAARIEAKIKARLAAEKDANATAEASDQENLSNVSATAGVEVENLDELWALMEYGDNPEMWQ